MSNEVDQRIVEMQFDNANFEKNVSTTMNTLDRLKASLDMSKSTQSIENLLRTANSFSLNGMETAVQSLSDRFSTLGIIGMTVIQNLTNTVTNAVKSIAGKVKNMVVQGGITRALNIEDAKFRLNGLKVAWEDIEEDINYGVKDTAYGLDSAAKAASVLVASGVKLGDEMKQSLRAISGVAAMTNSDYDSIASIFETVSGQGKLMTMQLRQLETRGLNAAATLGKALGKSEAQIRDMVTHGEIDFKTFAKAMDDAFGEHAKDANKTFTGAMANVKAAMARIGAKFATPGLESLRQIFVELIPIIDNVSSSLGGFVDKASNAMEVVSNEVQNALGYIRLLQNGRSITDTVFGNIDTNNRKVLKWTDKNIKKYKKEMEDWGLDPKDIKGDISTVLGSYSTFTNSKGKNVNIAFSPMLQTKDGAVLLSKKTVDDYIFKLIEKAGKNWTGEDLLKLDAKGIEIDGQKIKGLLADVGDTAKETSALMHLVGKDGALKDQSHSIRTLIDVFYNLYIAVKNIGKGAIEFLKPFGQILIDNFGDGYLPDKILSTSKAILNFSENLNTTSKTANHIEHVFKQIVEIFRDLLPKASTIASNVFFGFRSVINIVKDAWFKVFGNDVFNSTFHGLLNFKEFVSRLSTKLVELTERFILTGDRADKFRDTMVKFFTHVKNGITYIKTFGGRIQNWGELFSKIGEKLKDLATRIKEVFETHNIDTSKVTAFIEKLKNTVDPIELVVNVIASVFEGLGKIVATILPYIVTAFTKLGECCKKAFEAIKEVFSGADSGKAMDIINGGLLATLLYQARYLINTLTGGLKQFAPQFSLMFNEIKDSLIAYQKSVKVGMLMKTAGAIALLAASCLILSNIPQDKLQASVDIIVEMMVGITTAVSALVGVMWYFSEVANKFKKDKSKLTVGLADMFRSFGEASKLNAIGSTLLKMAASILILAVAVKILSGIDTVSMWSSIGAIVVLLAALTGVAVVLGKIDAKSKKGIKGLMSMAIAVDILTIAVKTLGKMSLGDLAKGVGAVIILLASLMGVCIGLSKLSDKGTIKSVGSLVSMAIAIDLLAIAVKTIGNMDTGAVVQGVVAIGALLTLIGTFCTLLSKFKVTNIEAVSSAMVKFSIGIAILAISMKILGSIGWDGIGQGLVTIGGLLLIIEMFAETMDVLTKVGDTAKSLVVFATAIAILALCVKVLSGIEFENMMTAMIAIAGFVAIFGVFAERAQSMTGLTTVTASLVIFAAAIAILVPPLILLSGIPADKLIVALLGIGIAVGILGVAAQALEPAVIPMLGIAGALALLGAACALFGVGVLAIGAGLTSIVAAVGTAGGVIIGFVAGLISLIPLLIVKIGEGIIGLLQLFIDSAPLFLEAVVTLLNVMIGAIERVLPRILLLVPILITKLCETIVASAIIIANAVFKIIEAVLTVIAENIYQIVDLASEIIIQFLEGIADNLPDIIQAGVDVIVAFLDGIGNSVEQIADAGFDLIIDFIDGISDSIEKNHDRLHTSIVNLIDTICTTATEEMTALPSDFLQIGKDVLQGLINGFNDMLASVGSTIANVADSVISTAKSVLGINSPSKEFFALGMYTMVGFANGITKYTGNVIDSAENSGNSVLDAMKSTLINLSTIVDNGIDSSPTIRPVLDLTNIQNGVGALDEMFGASSIKMMANVEGVNQMISNRNASNGNSEIVGAINTLRKSIEDNPSNVYTIGDVRYDDGSAVSDAVNMLINEIVVGGRV